MYRKMAAVAGLILFSAAAFAGARAEDVPTFDLALEGPVFKPAELRVPAGKPFIINFTNSNAGPAELESIDLRIEKIAPPNSTIVVRVLAADKGTYEFVDEFQEHIAKGTIIAE